MSSGFIIKELRLTGTNLKPASVVFKEGLNVISGPSNTGKTFVFECIDYMLGASRPPKSIVQARKYKNIFLEIEDSQGNPYALSGGLKGGDVKLYNTTIAGIKSATKPDTLERRHSPNHSKTVSGFFLNLNNLYGYKIRKNSKGVTRTLSYRDICQLLLIDETRIIDSKSPINKHSYTQQTEAQSVMKLLVTGVDDSTVTKKLNKDEVTFRRGKLELLSSIVGDLQREIQNLGFDDNSTQTAEEIIDSVADEVSSINKQIDELNEEWLKLDKIRKKKTDELAEIENQFTAVEEVLSRSAILAAQYNSDLARLNSTIEASLLLQGSPAFSEVLCPLCSCETSQDISDSEIDVIINSCIKESEKIKLLEAELRKSVVLLNEEREELLGDRNVLISQLLKVNNKLDKELGAKLSRLLQRLKEVNQRNEKLVRLRYLRDNLKTYTAQMQVITVAVSKSNERSDYEKNTTAIMTPVSKAVRAILKECNFPDLKTVSFSEEAQDFILSGEGRSLFGKGYRAIIFASFVLGLIEYVGSKSYSLGVPVLDSPLVTYKKPETEDVEDITGDEFISNDLAMNFYRYCANKSTSRQTIILENETPPADIANHINHIVFTRSSAQGRYGFIPQN